MRRRRFLASSFVGVPVALRAEGRDAIRGRFELGGTLTTAESRRVRLQGDDPTRLVLNDPRLKGFDFEAVGRPGPGKDEFTINPIHLRSMWAYRNGQRLMVTYWCDICYIRTYSPGQCWCCQEDTKLDLKDPNSKDPTP